MTSPTGRAPRPRCPQCHHLTSVHCESCWCGCAALRSPPVVREVDGLALHRLRIMASLAQRGMAAAEQALAAGEWPDATAVEHARQGYMAVMDLVHALDLLLHEGRMPEPARRWLLGIPDHALPRRRHGRG